MVLSYTSIMVLISGFVNRLVAGKPLPEPPLIPDPERGTWPVGEKPRKG